MDPAEVLLNPLPMPEVRGIPLRLIGVALGWGAVFSIYVSLAFMKFTYRWRS